MVSAKPQTDRRAEALSEERIIAAAIRILDASNSSGTQGLTLRALMTQLSTGSGAIYYHVSNMDELRAAAADTILRRPLESVSSGPEPNGALRVLALGIFDAVQAHAWLGTELTRNPTQPAVLRMWKTFGQQLHRLGFRGEALTNAGSTLANYILGASAQYAAGPSRVPDAKDRSAHLERVAQAWTALDRDPVIGDIASQLRTHDDRQQFDQGISIILAGIAATLT